MIASKIALQLPDGWVEIDLDEPDLAIALTGHDAGPTVDPDSAMHLLGPLTLELGRLAAEADVVVVGLFARTVPIDGRPDPLVLTGQALLTITPEVSGRAELNHALPPAWTAEPVDLPAGPGVRWSGRREITHPAWPDAVPAAVRQYFVSIPGTNRFAALTFLTPNMDLVDQFDEVFQAIAETLEFGYEDEPVTSGT